MPNEHGEMDKDEQERESNESSFLLLVGLVRGLNSRDEGDWTKTGE